MVNYSFIVTHPQCKNLPQNAAWKLIIWLQMEKKIADCSQLNPTVQGEHLTIQFL